MSGINDSIEPGTDICMEIIVKGTVQGIGYRPFVAAMADAMGIAGSVCNQGGIVCIRAMGTKAQLDVFADRLRRECPPGGGILSVETRAIQTTEKEETSKVFHIVESRKEDLSEIPVFPPDLGVCSDCLREMENSNDRRYRYGLISCVSCGPRWSILEAFPYDRERITMKKYPMCPVCKAEYTRKGDRRRHAQTISCHDCGPQMYFIKARKKRPAEKACEDQMPEEKTFEVKTFGEVGLQRAVRVLQSGGILVFKGVGGYQLCCSPFSKRVYSGFAV